MHFRYPLLQTPRDLYNILGIDPHKDHSRSRILSAASNAISEGFFDFDHIRLAFNIVRDPYYRRVFTYYGTSASLWSSGFIDDMLPIGEIFKYYRINKITNRLKSILSADFTIARSSKSATNAILVATGAFAPIHSGHIEMLFLARSAIERSGINVLAGLICPEHDSYIRRKGIEVNSWTAKIRLSCIEDEIRHIDWLCTDAWASMCVPSEIMFTDVLQRTSLYAARQLNSIKNIRIVHVFGGDNARQARAFIGYGQCACVNRHGSGDLFHAIKDELRIDHQINAFFVDETPVNESSTQIRNHIISQ